MKPFSPSAAQHVFEMVVDSYRGFQCVNEKTRTFGLYNYCSHRAQLRLELATTLEQQLLRCGYDIAPHGSALGALHRLYLKLKSLMGTGKRGSIREIVRGENYLQGQIEIYLASVAMPSEVADTLRQLHKCVSESKLELTALGAASRTRRNWRVRAH